MSKVNIISNKQQLYSPLHIINKLKQQPVNWFKPETCWSLPTAAQIETINRCNCRCIMCPIEELSNARPPKIMNLQEFKFIIDQLFFIRAVELTGIGEPLLNIHLFEIIEYCNSKGISSKFVTNAMLLDSQKADSLIRSGLSSFNVSIDSVNPETFKELRVNADLNTVSKNVRNFINLRNSLGLASPTVNVISVVSIKNKDELPDILQYTYDLGVDGVFLKTFNPYYNGELEIPSWDTDYQISTLEKARQLQNAPRPFSVRMEFSVDKSPLCGWPWILTYITAEGDVTPCCLASDAKKLTFGNVHNEPFAKIWNNQAYRNFRKAIKRGVPPVCSTCDAMINYLQGKK